MKAYDHILMDADDTLFDFRKAELCALAETFALYGIPFEAELLKAYDAINAGLWKALEQGTLTQEALRTERFRLLFEALGIPEDSGAFSDSYVTALGRGTFLLPDAEPVMAALSRRCRVTILTNGIAAVQRARISGSAIAPYVHALVISEEAGCSKPSPAIFAHALKTAGIQDKNRVLVVGDSLTSDIRGGADAGLDTCWYNPSGAPAPAGLQPTHTIRRLTELLSL